MILLLEYFVPQNEDRHNEYLKALKANINNQHITKIILLLSDESVCPLNSDKIEIWKFNGRPTFQAIFNMVNSKLPGQICIIANADIEFDDTLSHITDETVRNKFIALNRWEMDANGDYQQFRHNIGDSQDSWIFKTPIQIQNADFRMGQLGCDNRITHMAYDIKMDVINPSYQVITKHHHKTQYRTISQDRSQTVGGWHMLAQASPSMNTPSVLIKRFWG